MKYDANLRLGAKFESLEIGFRPIKVYLALIVVRFLNFKLAFLLKTRKAYTSVTQII
jgi:hypothetical protein